MQKPLRRFEKSTTPIGKKSNRKDKMYTYNFNKTMLVNTLFRVVDPPRKALTQVSCVAMACPYFKSAYLNFPDFGRKSAFILCKPTFSRSLDIREGIESLKEGDYFYATGELRNNHVTFNNLKPDLALEIDEFHWDESKGRESKLKPFVFSSIDLSKIVKNPLRT